MASPTWRRVQQASGRLSRLAVQRMDELPWFAALGARERAEVGLVVQAGLEAFIRSLRQPFDAPAPGPEIFAVAPRQLVRSVSLKQTVQLIRVVVGLVDEEVPRLAAPGEDDQLRLQVLRYSRDIAFAAAEVHASAAEARGAWDARVEAGVVEALVRGQVGEFTLARATSLGWTKGEWVTALAGRAPSSPDDTSGELRAAARHHGLCVLTGEAGGGLLVVLGGTGSAREAVDALAARLPDGPVVVGPFVDGLEQVPDSVGEALAGLGAVAAWPEAPRPVDSGELIAERAVLGDERARRRLLEEIHSPLTQAGGDLLKTACAFLDVGGSIEGTARALFVHPNTVRYRLRRIAEVAGRDLTVPRSAHAVRLAVILGRVDPL
ncbi:MAG TPA: helix-turn-helix domain-containing protein [Frankiaceae bacterium]